MGLAGVLGLSGGAWVPSSAGALTISGCSIQPKSTGNFPNLRGVNLAGADLHGISWVYADLEGTNLSGVNLQRAYLYRSRLTGANLSWADLSGGVGLTNTEVSRTDLAGANLGVGANLSESISRGINLSNAHLPDAILYKARFIDAIVPSANPRGAQLNSVHMEQANLSGANLSGADLRNAFTYGPNMTGANLSGIKLNYTTTLFGADLRGATGCPASLAERCRA